ncbi:hypothetical protein LEP1GSC196_2638 [Leptospira meyeri serovar Semaranga str. Veldrot Semarang 173]|nr:hypothetical protein LEP1GSC196_2638 [Leptospira meyeri serovar Semaranga str. Veldrot Semarang 173]
MVVITILSNRIRQIENFVVPPDGMGPIFSKKNISFPGLAYTLGLVFK